MCEQSIKNLNFFENLIFCLSSGFFVLTERAHNKYKMLKIHTIFLRLHDNCIHLEIVFSYTIKKKSRIVSGKTVFDSLINGKRVYQFTACNKPFCFVFEMCNKRKKRLLLRHIWKKGFIIRCKLINLSFTVYW